MPSGAEHQLYGALITGGVSATFLYQRYKPFVAKNVSRIAGLVALAAVVGYFVAVFPDRFEPATSPQHRDFFHSITFMLLLALLTGWAWKKLATIWAGSVSLFSLAYGSHLLLDGWTPYGLPWLFGSATAGGIISTIVFFCSLILVFATSRKPRSTVL